MIEVRDIYIGAERLINQILRSEVAEQGHRLTGALEDSFTHEYDKDGDVETMTGIAVSYARFVDDGFPAASASMKQFPFLVQYFQARGLPIEEAKGAAAATIKTWQKQGMPSLASKRFSSTGSRTDFILSAFTGAQNRIDEYMSDSLDFGVDEEFKKTKNETI